MDDDEEMVGDDDNDNDSGYSAEKGRKLCKLTISCINGL